MKRLKIIFVGLISLIVISCSYPVSTGGNELEKISNEPENQKLFGISIVEGNYAIDTLTILSNENLAPLINELENTELTSKSKYEEAPKVVKSLLETLTNGFDITTWLEKTSPILII